MRKTAVGPVLWIWFVHSKYFASRGAGHLATCWESCIVLYIPAEEGKVFELGTT